MLVTGPDLAKVGMPAVAGFVLGRADATVAALLLVTGPVLATPGAASLVLAVFLAPASCPVALPLPDLLTAVLEFARMLPAALAVAGVAEVLLAALETS